MSLGTRGRLLLVLLLGLAVRLVVMLRVPEVHHDEAVNGLMARHVLRGEFPVFFWGQDHAGTLAAYLIAVPFAVLDASADATVVFDLHGRIRYANEAARLAHGYSHEEMLARFFAAQTRRNLLVHVGDGPRHALSQKTLAAIPQL